MFLHGVLDYLISIDEIAPLVEFYLPLQFRDQSGDLLTGEAQLRCLVFAVAYKWQSGLRLAY